MRLSRALYPLFILALTTVGCGAGAGAGADASAAATQQQDYGGTKQMVLDILHSSDGKKAIQEVVQDPAMKKKLIVSEADVNKALEKMLTDKKSKSLISDQLKDPKFAATFAKAVQPELLQMQRQLMKDPKYQKDMLVLMKSPDFTKMLEDYMQTPKYRGQVMKVMTEALQTPSFRMQFQDALKKAVSESMQQTGDKKKESSGSGGQT